MKPCLVGASNEDSADDKQGEAKMLEFHSKYFLLDVLFSLNLPNGVR
jgi:hypothetical protein